MTDTPSLPALREAVAKMTPGPWKAVGIHIGPVMETGDWTPSELKRYEDAAGIVALRNAAPALLDEVERLRARTCATCYDHWVPKDEPNLALCGRIGLACQLVGNTCGAYAAKEPTP